MGHRGESAKAIGVLVACALTASLLGAASAGAQATGAQYTYPPKHFHVLNLTTKPMKLIGVEWDGNPEKGENAPPPPKVGDVLAPGAPGAHISIEHKQGPQYLLSSVHLTYRTTGLNREEKLVELSLWDSDPAKPGPTPQTAKCDVPTHLRCEANVRFDREKVRILDPQGTGISVTPYYREEQAELLRNLCTRKNVDENVVKCDFRSTASQEYGPLHMFGQAYANCGSSQEEKLVPYSERVVTTNSLGIGRSAETQAIFEQAKAGAKRQDPQRPWNDEHTFQGEARVIFSRNTIAWAVAKNPILRHTGTYSMDIGNTFLALLGVFFETPDPRRPAVFDDDLEYMTEERRKDVCTSDGLVPVPARYAKVKQRGTRRGDALTGGRESTTMIALAGSDLVSGVSGDDRLFGGPGLDVLRGGPGSDTIVDHRGRTRVLTGAGGHSGPDSVDVRDGEGDDVVTCGNRNVTVKADTGDRVRCRG